MDPVAEPMTSITLPTCYFSQVAIRKGIIKFIPKTTPAGINANVACVGIENIKIAAKIAKGELSPAKGIDQMGRTTVSMVGGLAAMAKGASIGAILGAMVPVVGPALSVVGGVVGGSVGYLAGSKFGESLYNAGKKVASVAKGLAKTAVTTISNGYKAAKNWVKSKVKNFTKALGLS